MEEALTVIPNVHKKLSSGVPFVEAKKNLTDDLAEGTDAPMADNSSIPSNMLKEQEDLQTTSGKSVFSFF